MFTKRTLSEKEAPLVGIIDFKAGEEGNGKRLVSPSRAVAIIAVAAVAVTSVYVFYDFNGDSFDLSDRQVLLIVTDSMDGNVTEYKIHSFPADTLVMIHHLSDSEKQQIQVGDVISFRFNGILNHHRVVDTSGIESGTITTQGDNSPSTETVKLSDVNGEVIGTNHWLGVIVSFVREYIIFIVLAAVFIAASVEIVRWARRPEDNSKEEKI